VNEIGTQLD